MRWMARRRPGYGIAVIIGVLSSAWAHDFGTWCYEVFPLFEIRDSQILELVALEKIPEPPPVVALETLKYHAPAPPAPPKEAGALARKDGLRLKKKSELAEMRMVAILGALKDDSGAFAMLRSGDSSSIADALSGEEGGVVGGVFGSGSGDAVGIGGLGLRGEGVGGGGSGIGTLGHGRGSGGLAGIGELSVGGGHGATAVAVSGSDKDTSALRRAWTQRAGSAIGSRWMERMKSRSAEYQDSIRVIVRVIVDADGNDVKVELVKPSGIETADAAVLAAVRDSALPAPPAELLDSFGNAQAVITVVLRFD